MTNILLRKLRFIVATFVIAMSPVTVSHAVLILDFSFTNTADSTQTVEGMIFGLLENGDDQQASEVVVTSSPFSGAVGTYVPGAFNSFSLTAGVLTAVDFVGNLNSLFRLDFLGDIGDANVGNRAILAELGGGGLSITGSPALPDAFSVSPPITAVPSPAPLVLLGAGLIAFFSARKFSNGSRPRTNTIDLLKG